MDAGAAAFPLELTVILTRAGIDLTLERKLLQETLHCAIAARRYSGAWSDGHMGWVVEPNAPEPHGFFGRRLEEAAGWCLAWIVLSTPLRHEDGPT